MASINKLVIWWRYRYWPADHQYRYKCTEIGFWSPVKCPVFFRSVLYHCTKHAWNSVHNSKNYNRIFCSFTTCESCLVYDTETLEVFTVVAILVWHCVVWLHPFVVRYCTTNVIYSVADWLRTINPLLMLITVSGPAAGEEDGDVKLGWSCSTWTEARTLSQPGEQST